MSSEQLTGSKRAREEALRPETLEQAQAESVEVGDAMSAILPMPPNAQWHIMFENGTWIKTALEKINRVLPDVGVFSIEYMTQDIEDCTGAPQTMFYFFLTLCQELKERNGLVFLQYPLHYAAISP